jgi:hypothetical protein
MTYHVGDLVSLVADNVATSGEIIAIRDGDYPYQVRDIHGTMDWYRADEVYAYDSRHETRRHIDRVRALLHVCIADLTQRARAHDRSKLESPEREMFDRYTPLLSRLTYGSPEYAAIRQEMLQTALQHHYEHNDHHPEHYPNGINGMTLMALIEMLCDWKAAGERHADGSLHKSLAYNRTRFGAVDLYQIMENTARAMGWLDTTDRS